MRSDDRQLQSLREAGLLVHLPIYLHVAGNCHDIAWRLWMARFADRGG